MKATYVPPAGNTKAKLAIVGEQPGVQEVKQHKPFVGPAGRGLDECLQMAKINRTELYITNVIKDLDHPLKYYIDLKPNGRSVISKEGYQYIEELGEELSKLPNLNCIVATGNIPLLALTNRVGINKWRGSILESTIVPGKKVIPTLHTATFIPPKFNFLNKPLIVNDLVKALEESGFDYIYRTPREIKIKPTFEEAKQTLEYCYEVGLRGRTIDIDIEVMQSTGELDCIAFSWSPTEAISIPFRYQQGDYFSIEQEYEIMLLIAKIIESERVSIRGANFIFDAQFLFHKYGIVPRGEIHCTQIAQKILLPDYPAGLDFVTTTHTDIPYYKADGKQWMKMGVGTWETWWEYNGMDSIATSAAHPKQIQALIAQDNLQTYERQRKLIKPLIYMSERGIKIDVDGMIKFKEKEQEKLNKLSEDLNDEVGYSINYNSPKQLAKYFYEDLNLKPYKKRTNKGYTITTDVDALKRIARRGFKAAQIMLDIRSLSKRISTYLNIGKVDKDGRYRSSYKPVGAETGRISSGETIFGTGGNQQNWPHDLLKFFCFDECYIGYSIDLSQIENRIVAYVGGVSTIIDAFEQGIDLHRLSASILFNKPYDQISDEEGSSVLGDGRQSERYWGKKSNHAINYDVGYKTFALKNEMTEVGSKHLIEKVHRGYPQIRGGYHKIIQNMLFKNRTVTNLMGRKRLFLGPIIPSYPNVPRSACLNTYREAYAHLPQSTVADKINEHGVQYIYYNQDQFRYVELLTQIHDSVVFQIPLTLPWSYHAEVINKIKSSLEQPLYWNGKEIKTPADICIGFNMSKKEMIELKSKEVPSNINSLAKKLEDIYNDLNKTKVCCPIYA